MSPGVGVGSAGVAVRDKAILENHCLNRISQGKYVSVKHGHVLHAVINRKVNPTSKSKTGVFLNPWLRK